MKLIIKNSNLVFQRKHIAQVVYKDYWVRGSGQYIKLTDLNNATEVLGTKFNNFKGRLDVFIDLNTSSSSYQVFAARSSYLSIVNDGGILTFKNNGVGIESSALSGASDHYVEFDNSVATATIDGETETFNAPTSSATNYAWIFARGSNDENITVTSFVSGRFKFKRLRLYNATTNALLCDIRPALVDNVPCLYDSVSETCLFSADGTTMVVEDAE